MKKKVLIIVLVVAALIAIIGGFAYFMISDLQQEEKLVAEMTELSEMANEEESDKNAVKERLDRIVTKGDYAIVEKACKQYLSEIFNTSQKIADTLNSETISKALTVDNYKTDGPEFNKTKTYITETKQTLKELNKNYYELLSEEKVMSYINDKGLDSYYTDLYKQEMVGDLESERNDKTVEEALNSVITLLDNVENVIDFLVENKNAWQVEGENIIFNSNSLLNKYNELVENLSVN